MKNENSERFNIASYLSQRAKEDPSKKAVISAKDGSAYTFLQLEEESNRYASGLLNSGLKKGDRVVLFVKPSFEFIALTFALFKAGLVPVLIDPGMGKANLLKCIEQVEPTGFIAVPIAHAIRMFYKKYFKSIKLFVTVGKKWFWGGITHDDLRRSGSMAYAVPDVKRSDTAAILFTTGSTGIPKGVVYEHGMFDAQVKLIRERYKITKDDVDLPAFPLFALFDAAWGITNVIPDMNPAKPAQADPQKIIKAINDYGATITFGSPAIWNNVGAYCLERNIKLPSLKRILMAGAPVHEKILRYFKGILVNGANTHTPYGATEALPVTSMEGSKIVDETFKLTREGKGFCVGTPIEGATVKIIKLTDDEIPVWDDSLALPAGEIGEIAVKGDMATKEYFGNEKATAFAKIYQGDAIWHRMGDAGYFDSHGRLWFCGRKGHRVATKSKTLFTVMCEAIFNCHERVFRSALVGVGEENNKRPVIIIEPHKGKMPKSKKDAERFKTELLELGSKNENTKGISDILFHPSFPVDIRHNVKIFREKLAVWANGELK